MSLEIPLDVLKHLVGEAPEEYVHQGGGAPQPPPGPHFRQPDGSLGVGSSMQRQTIYMMVVLTL